MDFWDLPYWSREKTIGKLASVPYLLIPYGKQLSTQKILLLTPIPNYLFRNKYGYSSNIRVDPIIEAYLWKIKDKAKLPYKQLPFQIPRLCHPDHYLNIIQNTQEQGGQLYFSGWRTTRGLCDLRIYDHGAEYYLSDCLDDRVIDFLTLPVIITQQHIDFLEVFLKRGYYLPLLLRYYQVSIRRRNQYLLACDQQQFYQMYSSRVSSITTDLITNLSSSSKEQGKVLIDQYRNSEQWVESNHYCLKGITLNKLLTLYLEGNICFETVRRYCS